MTDPRNNKGMGNGDEMNKVSGQITQAFIDEIPRLAEACGARVIFVYTDALEGKTIRMGEGSDIHVYYITKTEEEQEEQERRGEHFLMVPDVPLSRMGQLKVAIFLALSRELVRRGDIIMCLAGLPQSGALDTVVVTQIGREFEMLSSSPDQEKLPSHIHPEVLEQVIDIATDLGSEGREGRPVGALFVVGDAERVISLSRQLILNPLQGYSEEQRNLLNPKLEETVKELSTLDGAFIIRGDGVIERVGAFLKTASQEEYELPSGLGARHHAAAAITSVTNSLAVTVSASSGTVTIFRGGKIMTEIERARSFPEVRRMVGFKGRGTSWPR